MELEISMELCTALVFIELLGDMNSMIIAYECQIHCKRQSQK